MFGTAGGILEFRSALLASRGFACLCLPYFRYEDLTENLSDLDLDYFMVGVVLGEKTVFRVSVQAGHTLSLTATLDG